MISGVAGEEKISVGKWECVSVGREKWTVCQRCKVSQLFLNILELSVSTNCLQSKYAYAIYMHVQTQLLKILIGM